MSDCRHGFVVRSASGTNRFLCKECDERFPNYPEGEQKIAAREVYEEKARKEGAKRLQQAAAAAVEAMYGTRKK